MFVCRGLLSESLLGMVALLAVACKAYDGGVLEPVPTPNADAGDGAVIVPQDGGPQRDAAGPDPIGQAGRGGGRDAGPEPTPSCEGTEGAAERCNGLDDDCDGVTDEDDASESCAADHTSALCNEGECLIVQCHDEYRDCDRDAATGCETAPEDPDHCGRCGLRCDLPNAIASCDEGHCVAIGCAPGSGDCDGDLQSCETPLNSLDNCGDCGEPCGGLANASPQCDSGSCGVKACLGNFGDCDGEGETGCETPLDTLENCGGCNQPCEKASCSGGVCTAVVCTEPTADCDADEVDCEVDLATDKDHCGGCGRACAFATQTPRATLACENKLCEAVCQSGYGDCDEDYASGCETSLTSTAAHCGACGRNCTTLLPHTTATGCSGGSCTVTTCASGWGDCDGVASNGCERNISVEGPCFPDTNCTKRTYGTHDYFFCANASSWSAARDRCRVQARGDLVNIGSAAENDFVRMNRASDAWIGARDSAIEGLWRWENNGLPFWRGTSNGSVQLAQYENWSGSQPDDFNGNEDCAEIFGDGTWNDQSCTATRSFVCEQMPDECPSSSSKVDPGQCGCGTADSDPDGDGFADCNETCDTDPNKQAPGVCGCGVSEADNDGDGTPNCRDDCPGDPTQTAECLTFVPTNFNPDPLNFSSQPSSTLNCGTTTVNTNDPDGTGPMVATITNWCGTAPVPVAQAQTPSGGPEAVIIALRGLTVTSGNTLRVTGNRPVIFAVDGSVSIAGTLDADASGSTPGAGGNFSCGSSQGGDGTGSNSSGAGGGGGGGFGTAGGRAGSGGGGSRGSGGVARGSSSLSPLFGGCAGGRGGGCSAANAAGGGAVQISASGTLAVTGTIRANGAAGTNGCGSEGGGNGGGSGGAIFLEATTLNVSGALQANGGRGGNGAGGPSGPAGSTSSSSPGGDGGSSGTNGGAGGGGGYGRIRQLAR